MLIIGCVFVLLGTMDFLFIRRFAKWWGGFTFVNKLTYSAHKHHGLTKEEFLDKRTEIGPGRAYWLVWLFLIRLFGVMLAFVGLFMIIQSLI